MEVTCYHEAYDSYGGSLLYCYAGDLLTSELGDYGGAVRQIELTACLRAASRTPRRTLEDDYKKFHADLKRLPRVTFHRQKQRVDIRFLSKAFTSADETRESAEKCNLAAMEILDTLQLIRTKLKRSDDFDVERFLRDSKTLLSKKRFLKEWQRIGKAADEKLAAIQATKDPWELLDIDWKKYHPKAHEILDDPFFWNPGDDMAPNGNDTGADLLSDFRRWNKRNPRVSPLRFLKQLLQDWGVKPIDWLATASADVRELDKEKPIPSRVCNEASIGLAFAVIKLRGSCPPTLAQYAQAALKRTELLVDESRLNDTIKSQWASAIVKMQEALNAL